MKSKKKLLTSVAALTLAAATLLGGTFAWQSISQTALNESTDSINPGGRLHNDIASVNDMDTMNYIYVENFTDEGGEDIYARIRLEEYMELVMNYGVEDVEVVKNVAGVKTSKAGSTYDANDATRQNEFDYTYELHLFGDNVENATDDYWTWTLGTAEHNVTHGTYMPTFNKNKDSLAADLNGRYKYAIGGITVRTDNYDMTDETGFVSYVDNEEAETAGYGTYKKTAYAIYDNDGNQADELAGLSDAELKNIIADGTASERWQTTYADAVHLESEEHTAKWIGNTNGTISMAEWLELNDGEYSEATHGGYWVYDTDGWVYWSSPIKSGTTTGPLLEGFSLNHEMNDTWYYAINVEAQFITADDLGMADNTGFYDESGWYDPAGLGEKKAAAFEGMGQAPTEDALKLLRMIGVDTGEADTTAPMFVSAVNPLDNNQSWVITISDLNDGDFPLTLKGYYLDSADAQISGEPYFTSQITVDEGVVSANITCADQYCVIFGGVNTVNTYDADNGTLTIQYHWITGSTGRYATLTVTDASGNTGSLSGSIHVADGVGCFTAGTQVSGPDGMVNIEDIEVGDQVYSLDLATGKKTEVTVQKVHDQWVNDEFYHITVGNETITATPEHLFYVNGEWVEARDLSVGDVLVSLNGAEDTTVTAIKYEKLDAPITVYNLTVDGDHNFLITDQELVVHNVTK